MRTTSSSWVATRSGLERHGREEVLDGVDLSRTVGWFTTIFPVMLDVSPSDEQDWCGLAKSVRRQIRALPGNGFGFRVLRYLGSLTVRDRFSDGQGPQIEFNYLGQWDSMVEHADRCLIRELHSSVGQEEDSAVQGPHLLDVVGEIQHHQLGFTWHYRPDVHNLSTVESVVADLTDALRRIARDCREAT